MNLEALNLNILPFALSLLEPRHDTKEARAMMIAIALQESGLKARRQAGDGPAKSYWQFERGGVAGIAHHKLSAPLLAKVCDSLDYPADVDAIHIAIEHNDTLAACCARLLLFTHPDPLPKESEWMEAWQYYESLWRPGKPRFESWERNYKTAWEVVNGGV